MDNSSIKCILCFSDFPRSEKIQYTLNFPNGLSRVLLSYKPLSNKNKRTIRGLHMKKGKAISCSFSILKSHYMANIVLLAYAKSSMVRDHSKSPRGVLATFL